MTKYAGVIGYPLTQSLSPAFQQAAFDHLGLDVRESLAIGDAGPDVSMFRVAGYSVAVANAPPEVQAEAQTVAPSNDEDGVAWALERFVLREHSEGTRN